MNKQAKRTKKTNVKSKAQNRDLKPKKDPKGGDEVITFNYGQIKYQK